MCTVFLSAAGNVVILEVIILKLPWATSHCGTEVCRWNRNGIKLAKKLNATGVSHFSGPKVKQLLNPKLHSEAKQNL